MTLVYTDKKIKTEHRVINPKGFSRGDKRATLVYTDDKKVKAYYDGIGVQVKSLKEITK